MIQRPSQPLEYFLCLEDFSFCGLGNRICFFYLGLGPGELSPNEVNLHLYFPCELFNVHSSGDRDENIVEN